MSTLGKFYAGDESIRRAMKTRSFARPLLDRVNPALSGVEESGFIVPAFGEDTEEQKKEKDTKISNMEAYRLAGGLTQTIAPCIENVHTIVTALLASTDKIKQPKRYADLQDIYDTNRLTAKAFNVLVDAQKPDNLLLAALDLPSSIAAIWGGGAVSAGKLLLDQMLNIKKDVDVLVGRLRGYGRTIPGCGTLTIKIPVSAIDETEKALGETADFLTFLVYAALVGGGIYAASTVGLAYLDQKEKKGAK